jgi:hypothetical protein
MAQRHTVCKAMSFFPTHLRYDPVMTYLYLGHVTNYMSRQQTHGLPSPTTQMPGPALSRKCGTALLLSVVMRLSSKIARA